jgi:hypothetical protein
VCVLFVCVCVCVAGGCRVYPRALVRFCDLCSFGCFLKVLVWMGVAHRVADTCSTKSRKGEARVLGARSFSHLARARVRLRAVCSHTGMRERNTDNAVRAETTTRDTATETRARRVCTRSKESARIRGRETVRERGGKESARRDDDTGAVARACSCRYFAWWPWPRRGCVHDTRMRLHFHAAVTSWFFFPHFLFHTSPCAVFASLSPTARLCAWWCESFCCCVCVWWRSRVQWCACVRHAHVVCVFVVPRRAARVCPRVAPVLCLYVLGVLSRSARLCTSTVVAQRFDFPS